MKPQTKPVHLAHTPKSSGNFHQSSRHKSARPSPRYRREKTPARENTKMIQVNHHSRMTSFKGFPFARAAHLVTCATAVGAALWFG
ncbi:hypothetical protein BaRGS_00031083 [Batillaria attramentaria]|uniref:Uncharacterized protein n=1 Tax=Batillaria attramentaria TaxID=370345 RepID=A0ABD0JSU5_9CAEN